MRKIVKIYVARMWESCQRASFYVTLETDEGFTITPECHRTGSVYNNFEGLKEEEARDRALMDAATWGDLLELPVEPFVYEGVTYEPSRTFDTYTMRRELNERRAAKGNK